MRFCSHFESKWKHYFVLNLILHVFLILISILPIIQTLTVLITLHLNLGSNRNLNHKPNITILLTQHPNLNPSWKGTVLNLAAWHGHQLPPQMYPYGSHFFQNNLFFISLSIDRMERWRRTRTNRDRTNGSVFREAGLRWIVSLSNCYKLIVSVYSADELVATELLFNGVFNDLTAQQCCALLSCMAFQEKSKEMPKLSEVMSGSLRIMQVKRFIHSVFLTGIFRAFILVPLILFFHKNLFND